MKLYGDSNNTWLSDGLDGLYWDSNRKWLNESLDGFELGLKQQVAQ